MLIGKKETYDDVKESFAFDVERYVFNYNSGGYNLVIGVVVGYSRRDGGRLKVSHRGGSA